MTKINAVLPDELLKRYDYNLMSKEVRKIFNTVNLLKIRYDQVSMPTITSNYEIKYSSFVKRNNSKVEDYVVKKLTNEENLDKYLSKIVYAFSHLNQEEKIILVETYKKGTIDDEIGFSIGICREYVVNENGDSGYWKITTPKTRTSTRTIPMTDILIDHLKELKEECKKYYGYNNKWFIFGDINPLHPDVLRRRKNDK